MLPDERVDREGDRALLAECVVTRPLPTTSTRGNGEKTDTLAPHLPQWSPSQSAQTRLLAIYNEIELHLGDIGVLSLLLGSIEGLSRADVLWMTEKAFEYEVAALDKWLRELGATSEDEPP